MRLQPVFMLLLLTAASCREPAPPVGRADPEAEVPTATALSKEDAIAAVIAAHPQLAEYLSSGLPPRSVQAEQRSSGEWLVGFIRSGSGAPGIIDALCFQVAGPRNISQRAVFRRRPGVVARKLDLATCGAVATR